MPTKKYQRRSPQEWKSLVEGQVESGLSAPQFCEGNDISYASFSVWKRRFQSTEPHATTDNRLEEQSGFIDLSTLPSSPESGWRITLRLGNGVELELSQR
ncbi:MAG: IS66 family insertion sequence element accessory protein TnpB [Pseudomonadales bacterium]|nr:IS66 family insertion sequence element accessory protein TnpB [Pseudomonadales bacterium]